MKNVIPKLYAEIWIAYTPVWICSDLHLWHKNVLKYDTKRWEAFSTLEEHDDFIIQEINSKVWENDILIIVWDLALCNADIATEKLSNIVCKHKYWIIGNHDSQALVNKSFHLWAWICKQLLLAQRYLFQHHPFKRNQYTNEDPWITFIHWHTHKPGKYSYENRNIYDISYDGSILLYRLKDMDFKLTSKYVYVEDEEGTEWYVPSQEMRQLVRVPDTIYLNAENANITYDLVEAQASLAIQADEYVRTRIDETFQFQAVGNGEIPPLYQPVENVSQVPPSNTF